MFEVFYSRILNKHDQINFKIYNLKIGNHAKNLVDCVKRYVQHNRLYLLLHIYIKRCNYYVAVDKSFLGAMRLVLFSFDLPCTYLLHETKQWSTYTTCRNLIKSLLQINMPSGLKTFIFIFSFFLEIKVTGVVKK